MFALKSIESQHKKASATRSKASFLRPGTSLTQLHETVGKTAVQRLHESGLLQAKLGIGRPGDRFEQEADRVADQVMRMPEPVIQFRPT